MGAEDGFGRELDKMIKHRVHNLIALIMCICLPDVSIGQVLPNCTTQECYNEWLSEQTDQALSRIRNLGSNYRANEHRAANIASAYYNQLTDEFFIGDRAFHRDDHDAALATLGQENTRSPSGVGWSRISETEYVNYMRIVQGLDTPMDQTIYNNCVVARSRGASESVLREVRASCRETARDPGMLDRLRWGN